MTARAADKATLFREYLTQQSENAFINDILDPENMQIHKSKPDVVADTNIDDDDFERFKAVVNYYKKTDNEIKEIKSKIKLLNSEKKNRQQNLQSIVPTIMEFMADNEIDELNSKDGVIKYKKSLVKAPLTQKMLKAQLYDTFGDGQKKELDKIFVERQKVEKQTLKRVAY